MRNHIYRATYRPPAAAGMRPWTPADITTALWLDAEDASTITVDVGVSEWRDKSGNGRHVVQATGNAQPARTAQLNGRSVLTFDGGDVLVSSGNVPLGLRDRTCFIVACENAPVQNAGIFTVAPSGGNDYDSPSGVSYAFNGGWSGLHGTMDITGSTSSYVVRTANMGGLAPYAVYGERLGGTVGVAYRNGVAEGSDSSFIAFDLSSTGQIVVGSRYINGSVSAAHYLNGGLAEIIYCESALSVDGRQSVEGYLAHKWGLADELPADHPYRDAPPMVSVGGLDPDAQRYIADVEAADGQPLEEYVRVAVNSFVTGCKTDGIWDAIKACCILAGARTLAGALVPLKGVAPTASNTTEADYDRKAGWRPPSEFAAITTNRANNADPQDNHHLACYGSFEISDAVCMEVMRTPYAPSGWTMLGVDKRGDTDHFQTHINAITASQFWPAVTMSIGFIGATRSSPDGLTARAASTNFSVPAQSATPTSAVISVGAVKGGGPFWAPGVVHAFYSIGEHLDLALLEARVSTLMSTLASVIP